MAAMSEHVTQHLTIEAGPDAIWAVLLDFPSYPEWAPDLKAVEVVERDDQGRPSEVAFRAAGMGRSTTYTLRYDYSDPARLAWKLVGGDVTRKLDGHYELVPRDDGSTDVTYQLEAQLAVPLPGFVKRRAQGRITHTALHDLKARVERTVVD